MTPLNALVAAVRSAWAHDPRAEAAPEAVLWCDPEQDFAPLLPLLRRALPNLLTLGAWDAAHRQGPAPWLRAAAGGAVPDVAWEGSAPAVLYLPGAARDTLRAVEDCPDGLRLLAWYTVAGTAFAHPNGRDWTLRAFLTARAQYGGLGLDIAGDHATGQALAAAAPRLFATPVAELQGKRLDAAWLHALLAPDLAEDALDWLGGGLRAEDDPARHAAFRARAKAELKIDPAKVSPEAAAARLLRRDAGWSSVWERFVHGGPGLYEPVAAILAPLEPQDLLHADPTVYAAVNARREAELRAALLGMGALDAGAARAAALRLASEHGPRRSGPWAERGLARLADAAHWLGVLAAAPALPAGNAASLAEAYAATGWQADDAAVRALAAVAPGKGPIETLPADRDAVAAALRALYLPWMQRGAETLQRLLAAGAAPGPAAGGSEPQGSAKPDAVLFVDGLRMDLAHRLADLLRKEGAEVSLTWRWAGFPSVTATCKPLASPAAPRLHGGDAAEGFEPLAADGKRVAQPVLLRELAVLGWHPPATNTGPGQGASAAGRGATGRVWAEAGHFDRDGHAQASRMADGVEAGLRAVAAAALGLARGGRRLRVATDHGWLLLPGGLPVAHLPAGLAETVWRRCAVVKPGAPAGALQLSWSWNPAVPVATAPGAHVFRAGTEYAHGGISPQESVVAELLVTAGVAAQSVAVQCEWSGLRLRVQAQGGDGLRVALRLGAEGEGATLLDRPRTLDADGRTSLLVADDRLLGEAARLELRDAAGRLVAGQAVRIGDSGVELDQLDKLAAEAFRGLVVRKDLVRQFRGQFPVPTYVVEFLLGRYCATTDEQEIAEGLDLVRSQLSQRTVRAGEDELVKSRARETGATRVIDLVTARLDAKSDSYLATLPSLRLADIRLADEVVRENERMLTGGFYAEVELGYDATIAQERGGRPFQANAVRPIQLSTRGILDRIAEGRARLSTDQWKALLLRSVGLEPEALTPRARDVTLLRMVPFVERNYNLVELGPRGTGKSHLFQQVSPYAHLVSGGKATVARMFVNMANGQRGLVCQYDVVCFDEVSGVSFDQKDGVNIMKGYMESGEFSRGRESIRAEGSIVLVGNFDVDVQHQQRVGHLFGPLPPEMRNDAAFMDRIHAYLPGWDVPKLNRSLFTDRFGLVSDVLAEAFSRLRDGTRADVLRGRVGFGGALSGRDVTAATKTISGLLKLLHPDPSAPVPDEDLEWAVRLALEVRRRVKEQQKRIGAAEFRATGFSYSLGPDGVEHFVATPELHSEDQVGADPLPPGQVWALGPGGGEDGAGLYRIEVQEGPGSGVRILNHSPPAPFREALRIAEHNLYARGPELVGGRNPRGHEFAVQLKAFDAGRAGGELGVAALLALCSALLGTSLRGGMAVAGSLSLGGAVEPLHDPLGLVELAIEKGASKVLVPVACRRALVDLSDTAAAQVQVLYYLDAADALRKALHEG